MMLSVHVIAMSRLREFWEKHPAAERPLRAWFKLAKKARWRNIADLHKEVPKADYVPPVYTVFNTGSYRLIVVIEYRFHMVFVFRVFTHDEYDRWTP